MRMRKKLAVILLLVCLLYGGVALAKVSPMFVNIRSTSAELTISGNTANCYGGVQAYSAGSSCTISMKLQKKNGSSWTTLKTWSDDGNGSAAMSETYTISSGTYRVKVSGTVAGESYSVTTGTKTKN